MDHQHWHRLATDLGMSAFEESIGSTADDRHCSFAVRLRRRSGPPTPDVRAQHLLAGVHGGARILLRLIDVRTVRPSIEVTVELAPSLGLGAFVASPRSIRGLSNPKGLDLGHAALDAELCLEAMDPPRLRELLFPRSEADMVLLRTIIGDRLVITDTTVVGRMDATVRTEGVMGLLEDGPAPPTDANAVRSRIDRWLWVAREVGARRRRVQVTPAKQQMHAAWRKAAADLRIAFDAEREVLHGDLAGARITMGLETRLSGLAVEERFEPVSTCIAASFSRPLGFSLRVEKAGMLNKVWELFGRDIVIGDQAFDRAFSVSGQPEETVRNRLRPAAAALVEAHARASELVLDDAGLFMLVPGVLTSPAEVSAAVHVVARIAAALGAEPAQGRAP